jgi:hypothetical protein
MADQLTISEARTAFVAVVEQLEKSLGYEPGELSGPSKSIQSGRPIVYEQGQGRWPSAPVLVRDFEERRGRYAIVWEIGEDWAMRGSVHQAAAAAGVYAEAYSGWALSLYPQD